MVFPSGLCRTAKQYGRAHSPARRIERDLTMASILIAEDAPAINSLMAANLRLVGHNCDQAYTGEQALAFSAKKTYDLVLLDVMLPGVDGFAVKAKLPPDQPVIFVTAKAALDDKLRGLGLGAEDYIVKPFEVLELLARVETVLRRTSRNRHRVRVPGPGGGPERPPGAPRRPRGRP